MWYKLKRIMIRPNGVEKQVRPDNRWTPWANTYIYYPLTSDLKDVMWNWNTGTMNWTCTFDSSTGIHVTGRSWNYVTWMSVWVNNRNTFTINVRVKHENNGGVWYLCWYGTYNHSQAFNIAEYWWYVQAMLCNGSREDRTNLYASDNNWHNICISWSNWTYNIYCDSILVWTTNTWTIKNISENQLWWWWSYGSSRSENCYVGRYIVETVARTAQEVADYYNQTKWNYGL